MTDTIIGVIIGGLIASIVPFTTLIFNNIRWKREAKLEYLRIERNRLENLCKESLNKLEKSFQAGGFSPEAVADIFFLMPNNVSQEIEKHLLGKDKTQLNIKNAYQAITIQMKLSLSKIDDQIKELVSK